MNKEIAEKARALNQWILSQEVILEFKKYEELISHHDEIKKLEDELKALQKDIVKARHYGNDCEKLIQKYQTKKKTFDENPLIYNYLVYKQEVNEFIHNIQNDINRQLKKKID